MMPIHSMLLPSGKVLFVSGSSWRNKAPLQTYPNSRSPAGGAGVFIRSEQPFAWSKLDSYYSVVNYNAIYDPVNNTLFRIPHPVPSINDSSNSSNFLPTDLFCTGHQHLSTGDVLFVGGTQYYSPYRTGNQIASVFDWKKELSIDWRSFNWTQIPAQEYDPWRQAYKTVRGRWYANMVPLLDGRLVVFGGYVGFDNGFPPPYEFEMNPYVDIFDSVRFYQGDKQGAWQHFDTTNMTDSPFATLLDQSLIPEFCNYTQLPDPRQRKALKYDAFKLYPQNYLLPDGRIFLSRDGDFQSQRTATGCFMRRTKFTYYMKVGGDRNNSTIGFSRGPDRPTEVPSSGTSVYDRAAGRILSFGGMPTGGGTLLPGHVDARDPLSTVETFANLYAGSRATSKLETYFIPTPSAPDGAWRYDDSQYLSLGGDSAGDRTMQLPTMLPSGQILIINGGNYDFYGPVYNPLLLTPRYLNGNFAGYFRTQLAPGRGPRLYHNEAILLPDARVLIVGGNAARATININAPQSVFNSSLKHPKPNINRVDRSVYFFRDGPIASGFNVAPAENWDAEVYSPPYLFIDVNGRRPVIELVQLVSPLALNYTFSEVIGAKTYYLLRSDATYMLHLSQLPTSCPLSQSTLSLMKLGSITHGWDSGQTFIPLSIADSAEFTTPNAQATNVAPGFYMLFLVDCTGVPSIATFVRFDDRANSVSADG